MDIRLKLTVVRQGFYSVEIRKERWVIYSNEDINENDKKEKKIIKHQSGVKQDQKTIMINKSTKLNEYINGQKKNGYDLSNNMNDAITLVTHMHKMKEEEHYDKSYIHSLGRVSRFLRNAMKTVQADQKTLKMFVELIDRLYKSNVYHV